MQRAISMITVLVLAIACGTLRAAEPPKPNVIIIFTDDQGYGDLGCFGNPKIKTPHIDKMAAEGMKFTSFYVASPVCTPSRAALLTGSYPKRVGLENHVLFPRAKKGLNPTEITIAEILKEQGYATACIGKWHLGDAPEFLPRKHGFDFYYGIPYSNDMGNEQKGRNNPPLPLIKNDETIEAPAKQEKLTESYTKEAVKFIKDNKDKPFFIYLPHTFPHVPLFVSGKFKGKSAGGLYGDVIEAIDWSTGEILKELKKQKIDEKTLVVFTTDNGPWLIMKERGGSAGPLRDGKGTTYEGGMRVPCVMRWPGMIPAGKECAELALSMDLLPTVARLCGGKVPSDRVIDGKDIRPLMLGQDGAKTPHKVFFYYAASGGKLNAVRSGKWKLHLKKAPELYDLLADIGEKSNVAADNAAVVEELKKLAAEHEEELAKNKRPVGVLE